jgi:hypothetical protein
MDRVETEPTKKGLQAEAHSLQSQLQTGRLIGYTLPFAMITTQSVPSIADHYGEYGQELSMG